MQFISVVKLLAFVAGCAFLFSVAFLALFTEGSDFLFPGSEERESTSENTFEFSGLVWDKALDKPKNMHSGQTKLIMEGKFLEFVGGFKVPSLIVDEYRFNSRYLDLLPGTKIWASGHPKDKVFILEEPQVSLNDFKSMKAELIVKQSYTMMADYEKISPSAVHWVDENQLLVSGRKSYRSGYEANWLLSFDLTTQIATPYNIKSVSNISLSPFETLQAFGAGFARIHDKHFAEKLGTRSMFLIGRGGYDVLGSPLGPSLAMWEAGSSVATSLIYYPKSAPAHRDPYYTYPDKDPNTYDKVRLPMWKPAEGERGFWQAGDVGGIAMISSPSVEGVIATKNFARGVLDYRAQGDSGSGKYFLVEDPTTFYSNEGRGNRGDHQSETLNQAYNKGMHANTLLVFSPDDLVDVANNEVAPTALSFSEYEWPRENLPWSERSRDPTLLGSVTWDDSRQLLWLAVGTIRNTYLVAYKIIPDKSRKEIPIKAYIPF